MKTKNLISVVLPLAFLVGCATSNREQAVTYTPANTGNLPPLANREQSRIYSDSATTGSATVSPEDAQLGEEVRQLLMDDKKLAPAPSNVIAVTHNGVVALQGTISSRSNKRELLDRIAQLPGVTRVDDQLKVR